MATSSPILITAQLRADLFAQLAVMDDAGVPAAQAFKTMARSSEGELATRSARVANALSHGQSVANAGLRNGIFSALDARLIEASELAANLAATYRNLSMRYVHAADRARRIRAQSMMPAFVLLVALFVAPLPGLVNGSLTMGGYLSRSVLSAVILAVFVYVIVQLPRWLREGWLSQTVLGSAVHRLNLQWPVLGQHNIRRNALAFLEAFGLLLEAGLPAAQALAPAVAVVANKVIATDLEQAGVNLKTGGSVTGMLSNSIYISSAACQLAQGGEAAGRPGESLQHFCVAERMEIKDTDDQLAAWIPRIVYALVAGWVAFGLIG